MIGKLSGIVDYVAADHVLLDCGGVGYVVYCAPGTLSRLPPPGGAAALYIDTVVREDLIQLFGFPGVAEREWHRLLTSVQGVGAKVSMALLGALGSEGVARALARGDAAAVRAAPGVGPKLASRIVNELQSKAPDLIARTAGTAAIADAPPPAPATTASPPAPTAEPDPDRAAMADALSALVNLGYDRIEAADAVVSVDPGDAAAMIRAALRHLAPKS